MNHRLQIYFLIFLSTFIFLELKAQTPQSVGGLTQDNVFTSPTNSPNLLYLSNRITPVWSEDFAFGFTGSPNGAWTVGGANAFWEYTNAIQAGCYSATADAQANFTTKSNGFALFHSDDANCLDASATPPAITTNAYTGDLISPSINLSALSSVGITFEHLYRYCCGGDLSITFSVSNDGGVTWEDFEMHSSSVAVNAFNQGQGNSRPYIDISSVAANQSNVQLKFTWNADQNIDVTHYFWAIDDIELFEMPNDDLVIQDRYYTHSKLVNPYGFINSDSIRFQYGRIPFHQAGKVDFAGNIFNFGLDNQNARLEVDKGVNQLHSTASLLNSKDTAMYHVYNHS